MMQYQVTKSFAIDKWLIINVLVQVRKSKGSVDIDNVSTKEYESNLGKNLP